MTLPGAPPADRTNAVADEPAAAALGKALFEDAGLSPSGAVARHVPRSKTQLSDARPIAVGVAEGTARRTPRIALAAFSRWQGWDGKADTLWAQALGPLESEVEMAQLAGVRGPADRDGACCWVCGGVSRDRVAGRLVASAVG